MAEKWNDAYNDFQLLSLHPEELVNAPSSSLLLDKGQGLRIVLLEVWSVASEASESPDFFSFTKLWIPAQRYLNPALDLKSLDMRTSSVCAHTCGCGCGRV